MKRAFLIVCTGLAISASGVVAQNALMVLNSSDKTVMLFDPVTGSLVNPSFIHESATPTGWRTPKGIAQVDNEIWVADQLEDAIYRFDLSGAYIDMVAAPPASGGPGGLDNIRGLNYIDGVVYQTNAGTQNGAPGNALVRFDTSGTNLGHYAMLGSPFDVVEFGGNLLVSDITNHRLDIYGTDGTYQSNFHTGSLRFPQQIAMRANGNIIVGGFSNPSGIYEYDQQGTQVGFYPAAGVRGVFELENGNIMYTNGTGVHVYDFSTGLSMQMWAGASQYIARLGEVEPPCYADCDGNETLNIDDFLCFINEFSQAQMLPVSQQITHYANCDGSTSIPVLTIDDFLCFINEFSQGCP